VLAVLVIVLGIFPGPVLSQLRSRNPVAVPHVAQR
jgi:formate hydrogenlyase subunit 3/multisubunit Na+/H+ antiporter MnhD subunit